MTNPITKRTDSKVVRVRGDLYDRLNSVRVQELEKRGRIPSFSELVKEAVEAYLSKHT